MKIVVGLLCIFALIATPAGMSFGMPLESAVEKPLDQKSSEQHPLSLLDDAVKRFTLSNGLRVVFVSRNTAPIFSGQLWVKVGGVNEIPGKTGASHMLEHMAFKGTHIVGTKDFARERPLLERLERIMEERASAHQAGATVELHSAELEAIKKELQTLWEDNQFSSFYERVGAKGLNAATSKDWTFYTVDLPVASFELWCWLESDRILNPVFRQFYEERDVVLEERRMRVEDNPSGRLYEQLLATSYLSHPNRLPVIGWFDDVSSLVTRDVIELHRNYYQPDNMVISLVGDLQVEQMKPILEKYFGRIVQGSSNRSRVGPVEQKQAGSREVVVEYNAEPELLMAYHKPTYPDPDDSYFSLVHGLLNDGRSSVLQRKLVQEEKLATSVYTTEAPGDLYPSLFVVGAEPQKGVTLERLRDRIQEILDEMGSGGITVEMVNETRRRVKVALFEQLASGSGLAGMLGKLELLWGDWRALKKSYEAIEKATVADLSKVMTTYLRVSNRTTAFLKKPPVDNGGKEK